MRLRSVLADRLAFALPDAQQIDRRRTEHHHEQQCREDGATGSERDVAEDVQRADLIAEIDELIEHAELASPVYAAIPARMLPRLPRTAS